MAAVVPFIPYIIGAAAAVYQGGQQNKQAQEQANLDEANALQAKREGAAEEEAVRRKNAVAMGTVRAAAVDTGFAPGGGSLLNLQTQTAAELELDALTTRYRGDLQALGYQTSASAARRSGSAAKTSGYLNAASYMAGAAGKYYGGTQLNPRAYAGGMTSFYGGTGRSGD